MAVSKKRTCDYCERPSAAAHTYRVVVTQVSATGELNEVLNAERDLCERDLTRMLSFVHRGLGTAEEEIAEVEAVTK